MNLDEAILQKNCLVLNNHVKDEKTKFRLMELGLVEGCVVRVKKKSIFKKTLLIVFCSTCFTLKENLAKNIEVKYV